MHFLVSFKGDIRVALLSPFFFLLCTLSLIYKQLSFFFSSNSARRLSVPPFRLKPRFSPLQHRTCDHSKQNFPMSDVLRHKRLHIVGPASNQKIHHGTSNATSLKSAYIGLAECLHSGNQWERVIIFDVKVSTSPCFGFRFRPSETILTDELDFSVFLHEGLLS